MQKIKDLSIRTKIIFLIVVISIINTIIASVIYYRTDKKIYNREISEKLLILSKVIGDSNSATILFNDKKSAKEYMSTLKVEKSVEKASIILPDSSIFVSYDKNGVASEMNYPLPLKTDTVLFLAENIIANIPVIFKNDTTAYIRIKYNLDELKVKQDNYFKVIAIILVLTVIIAFILAYFFQKIITQHIFHLHKLMNKISSTKDFSVRSVNNSKDEIGSLSTGFNEMLEQIEKQNNELKRSKQMAEVSLKAKERFLANTTHELRTPLSSIVGITSLLDETPLNDEQKQFLKNIKLSSDHLLSVINDLLEFSKLGSKKLQFEKKKFNIRQSIERLYNSMHYEFQRKNLDFSSDINDNIPQIVIGDDYRLNQIFINLVGNALKFTPQGSIEVYVKKIFENELIIDLEFRIKDTGIGIEKEKQDAIFESFTQENNGTTRKYGGTGLGLAITKQLIELQGGKIRIESEKGKGSTFIFNIPYSKIIVPQVIDNDALNAMSDINILLVDDNPMNLMFTISVLKKGKFKVETAINGLDALKKLSNSDFDIVLCDLHMPEMDGYGLATKIRADGSNKIKNIPIIAVTAAATIDEINRCFNVGMNDYLIKPFEREDLISKVLYLTKKTKNTDND
ncbi:MAG: hypothetical protein B6I20_00670 [Bacteroidetes bacterium 4572_117]|nr:MAG: hypothetical protein B6I20_00670 [Bacteroidetes bacterium 4572_117]